MNEEEFKEALKRRDAKLEGFENVVTKELDGIEKAMKRIRKAYVPPSCCDSL